MISRWIGIFAAASASIALMGLPGCGCTASTNTESVESTQSTAQSAADHGASMDPTADSVATISSAEPVPTNDSQAVTPQEYSEGWAAAFKGSSGDRTFYYAESPYGVEAIMAIVGPDGQRESYVGSNYNSDETNITLTDDKSGAAISFAIVSSDPNAITLEIGEYGEVAFAPCDISEVAQAAS